jgi:hypothetical protein
MVMSGKPIVAVGSINIDPVARAERIPLAGETVHSSDLQIHPGGEGREKLITFRSAGESERLPNERVQALIIQLNVQGQSIRLVLDTGACELFLFEDRLRRQLPRLKLTNKLGQAHVGRLTGEMVTLPGIRLGTTELEAPAFLIGKAPDPLSVDIDGYLGVSALNPAFIEFDFDANTLRIEPKASPASLMKIGPTQEAVLRQHHSL